MTSGGWRTKTSREVTELTQRLSTLTTNTGPTPSSSAPSGAASSATPSSALESFRGAAKRLTEMGEMHDGTREIRYAIEGDVVDSIENVRTASGDLAMLKHYADGRQEFDMLPGNQIAGAKAVRTRHQQDLDPYTFVKLARADFRRTGLQDRSMIWTEE